MNRSSKNGFVRIKVGLGAGDERVVEAPLMRRVQKERTGRWPRIEVMGESMRVGKTTAAEVITEQLKRKGWPVMLGKEEWEKNVYLKDSYDESDAVQLSRFLLKSQRWFAKRKFEQVSEGFAGGVYVQDLNPEGDFAYALVNFLLERMLEADFVEYRRFYESLPWERVPAPDLLVYIAVRDEVLVQQALESVRDFEKVGKKYYLTMKRVNRSWLAQVKDDWPVLVINADGFDFVTQDSHQKRLGQIVVEKLARLGWGLRGRDESTMMA